MKRIIRYTETYGGGELKIDFGDPSTRQNAISAAAIILARQMGAKGIIAETTTGQTARNLASYRPPVHIITATHKRRVYQQMSIIWGGNAYLLDSMVNAGDKIVRQLKKVKYVKAGDALVMAAGRQPGVAGGTDTVHIKMVK
jgi:pyruvate kinase